MKEPRQPLMLSIKKLIPGLNSSVILTIDALLIHPGVKKQNVKRVLKLNPLSNLKQVKILIFLVLLKLCAFPISKDSLNPMPAVLLVAKKLRLELFGDVHIEAKFTNYH